MEIMLGNQSLFFIKNLHIKSLRHLQDIEIYLDYNQPINLIVTGRNGAGKTSLLESISNYLKNGVEKNLFNENRHTKISELSKTKSDIQELYSKLKAELTTIGDSKVTDDIKKKIKKKEKEFQKNLGEMKPFLELDIEFNVTDYKLVDAYNEESLFFSYLKDYRDFRGLEISDHIKKEEILTKTSIDEILSYKFHNYLVRLRYQGIELKEKGNVEESQRINEWLSNFEKNLQEAFHDDSIELDYDFENFQFLIKQKNRNNVNFKQLSAGFSSVINIVAELVMRFGGYNYRPYSTCGIVLIDEIETHLHPELEMNILPFLTKTFPLVQFIVTTHSPIVAASLKNSVVFDLETQNLLRDSYFFDYSSLLENHFSLKINYSKELEKDVSRFCELSKNLSSLSAQDKKELMELDLKLMKLSPVISPRAWLDYNEAKKLLI